MRMWIAKKCLSVSRCSPDAVAQVGRAVYNTCILGALRGKTRLLVTNQLQYVSQADVCVLMSDGRLAEVGTYKELMASGGSFAQLMSQAEVRWCSFFFMHCPASGAAGVHMHLIAYTGVCILSM